MFSSPKQALQVILGLVLTIIASLACNVTINPAQVTPVVQPIPVAQIIPVVQPVPVTQVITVVQPIPVTQVVPVTRVAEETPVLSGPKVILTRLQVSFLGQDGSRVIGSGCPGEYGKGTISDYHLLVRGADPGRRVERVIVAGDRGTDTWEWPCQTYDWELMARDSGEGDWDIFIAPSVPQNIYNVFFFYDDNTLALGMVSVR